MRLRYGLALALFFSASPALACRCRVATTPEQQVAYADEIAARSKLVAIGRFTPVQRNGLQRFAVGERLVGSPRRRLWVVARHGRAGGPLSFSGSCTGIVTPWESEDRALVLRRREDDAAMEPGYQADACATHFLQDHPDALDRLRRP